MRKVAYTRTRTTAANPWDPVRLLVPPTVSIRGCAAAADVAPPAVGMDVKRREGP
jgi:hypothetical protein